MLVLACASTWTSCKKDSFITSASANLSTSTDTLKFDTVFTSVGSVTQSFKINNLNNQKLLLSKIKLIGGSGSFFKININGIPAPEVTDIEVAANDSVYVFVSVKIDPSTANLPFIVRDSIQIMYNGNSRFVQLEAYGQNANFLRNRVITGNVTWTNNLPYVILGSLRIDTTASLIIPAGCKIYAHADAPIIVDGTLSVNGTKQDSVVFTGDRMDPDYKNLPASWPGIYFRGKSKNNVLQFAVIKNAYQAIVAEQPSINANPKLVLHQCIIDNAYDAGLLCVNTSLRADNSLISNCGNNITLALGGDYTLTHCTVTAYSGYYIQHKNPVLKLSNYLLQGNTILTNSLTATFRNCIFWGDNGVPEDEVSVLKQGTDPFSVTIDHCLYKAVNDPAAATISNCIKNQSPLFDSVDVTRSIYDFHTSRNPSAPGIDKGTATSFLKDLDNLNRNVGLPDIGCYEKQ